MEEDNSLWEYNAPQFVDFKSMEDDENVEEYFSESFTYLLKWTFIISVVKQEVFEAGFEV